MQNKMPRTPFSTGLSKSARETELRIRNIFSGPKRRPPVLFLPLGGALPRSREAWMVDLVDTICAGLEISRICRPSRLRERLGVRPLVSAAQ